MNVNKVAAALNTISVAFGELAEAVLESGPGERAVVADAGAMPAKTPGPADLPPSFDELPPEDGWLTPELTEKINSAPQRVIRGTGDVCPDHDLAWEVVPGGVSKRTGKSYRAFWHCPSLMCKQKPEKEWQDSHPAGRAA